MRQCQLMRKLLEFAGSRAERKAARTWSGCGCVEDVLTRSYRKCSGLVQCVCSVIMWVLYVSCGMGCLFLMSRRHLTESWCPEHLGGSYVGVVWPLAACSACGPL